ncbi:MAG: SDR family NAD(P)-dependent oxidoreductase, partial [Pseudomonadota bacterium]
MFKRLVAVSLTGPADGRAWIHDDSVILITGGAGGLGRLFAERIRAQSASARIILVGRSQRPDGVDRIEGAIYRSVDVADRAAVDRLVGEIASTYGRLDVVLHAAGVVADGLIRKRDVEGGLEAIAPKLLGTVNLDLATRALGPKMILFSSISGVFGTAGQADYAAANAFQDAFAAVREGTLSVAWPAWSEAGMWTRSSVAAEAGPVEGFEPLPSEAGFKALDQLLETGLRQAVVLSGDGPFMHRTIVDPFNAPRDAATGSWSPRPEEAGSDDPRDVVQNAVASIAKMRPEDIRTDLDLADYGFDSLRYTFLINELKAGLGVDLRQSDFIDHSTVDAIAELLSSRFAQHCVAEGPAPAEQVSDLSQAQTGLLVRQLADPQSGEYNLPVAFTAEEDFDQAAFLQAYEALYAETDALRTAFSTEDGIPQQRVLPPRGGAPIAVLDVTGKDDAAVKTQVADAASIAFDLAQGVSRLRVFARQNGATVVLIVFHHIVVDGVSAGLLFG